MLNPNKASLTSSARWTCQTFYKKKNYMCKLYFIADSLIKSRCKIYKTKKLLESNMFHFLW
jgi:hypothetical protein